MIWTVGPLLEAARGHLAARGVEEPRWDAELLLCEVLGVERLRLYTGYDMPVDEAQRAAYRELIKRRARREPLAYILGRREFYGREFRIDRRVLIPRSETEQIVDRARAHAKDRSFSQAIDLGTGSGCLAISVALELLLPCLAVDLSGDALEVARGNAERLGASDRVRFAQGDLWGAVPPGDRFDLCLANPPYIDRSEAPVLPAEVRDHEPELALYADDQGTSIIRRILENASLHLSPGAILLMELGAGQAERALALARELQPSARAVVHDDLARMPRILELQLPL